MANRHCPYCSKEVESFADVISHCEKYGSQYYNVKCTYCDRIMRVYAMRMVQISKPCKLIEEEIEKENA